MAGKELLVGNDVWKPAAGFLVPVIEKKLCGRDKKELGLTSAASSRQGKLCKPTCWLIGAHCSGTWLRKNALRNGLSKGMQTTSDEGTERWS